MARYLVLLFPILCAVLARMGYGYYVHVAIPISCALIVLFMADRRLRSTSWLLILAFLFAIAGDWMLGHRAGVPMRFIYGIGFFFVTHIGYLAFCLLNGKIHWKFLAIVLIPYLLFFIFALRPAISDTLLQGSVLLYLLISCISVGAAFGLRLSPLSKWLFFAGIACMVFSDTLIAFAEFLDKRTLFRLLMMPTYYASQILITASVIRE